MLSRGRKLRLGDNGRWWWTNRNRSGTRGNVDFSLTKYWGAYQILCSLFRYGITPEADMHQVRSIHHSRQLCYFFVVFLKTFRLKHNSADFSCSLRQCTTILKSEWLKSFLCWGLCKSYLWEETKPHPYSSYQNKYIATYWKNIWTYGTQNMWVNLCRIWETNI